MASVASMGGNYSFLPGTSKTAPASPATPPSTPAARELPVPIGPYEKLQARLALSLRSTLQSRYFYANVAYCFYCTGMLCIDFVGYDKDTNDKLYWFFGVVHLLNAWMYWWAWKGRSWKNPIVYPEYLNVLGAALYLWSAALYPTEAGPTDAATLTVHRIETAAAGIELLACVGWAITWHLTYVRVPGRGYTLDDPDVWALLTIFAGSTIYLTYNIQILRHPEWYLSNELFYYGDVFYASNGFLYLLASLRDDGWFFFMPLAGGFPDPAGQARLYCMVYKAERRQRIHESLEAREKHAKGRDTGGGLASAMVTLIVSEGQEELGAGYDVI